jgi:Ca2+-binding EF-hand superfamily protein
VSQLEFRNAIRKLNLGLSSREIDQLLNKIDTNSDGKISYPEFAAHFSASSSIECQLAERSKARMGQLKELMVLHMTSPNDAFRSFDLERDNTLTFNDFSKLVN